MLSDDPWSLVESFPRHQAPSIPSRLDPQPARSRGPTKTGWIGTNSPRSLDPSAPCPVDIEGPMTLGTKSHWARHRLANMVPVDLATLPPRTGMSLATLLHRRPGRSVPWLTSRPGTMVTRRPMSHDDRLPRSLGTSTIELPEGCWKQGLVMPSFPSWCGQHGIKAFPGTWVPSDCSGHGRRRPAGTSVPRCPGIQRSRCRQDRGARADKSPPASRSLHVIGHLGPSP
jgi:hypothetical protein